MLPAARVTRNLMDAAMRDELRPVFGLDDAAGDLLHRLCRANPPHIAIIGERGVGKTSLLHGVVLSALRRHPGCIQFPGALIQVNLSELLAHPREAAAAFQDILDQNRRSPGTFLYLDDFDRLHDTRRNSAIAKSLLAAMSEAMDTPNLRFIVAMTPTGYDEARTACPAFMDLFETIHLSPMDATAAIALIQHLAPAMTARYGVRLSDEAIAEAVRLSTEHLPGQQQPGSAIGVLQRACERARLKALAHRASPLAAPSNALLEAEAVIHPHDVRKVISEIASVDLVSEEIATWQQELSDRIRNTVLGQDEAIARISAVIARMRSGILRANRPAGLIALAGPRGCGKTLTIRALARELFGDENRLACFDLAAYTDPDTSTTLLNPSDGGLLALAVKDSPFAIVYLANVEKAAPALLATLCPVLCTGSLPSENGLPIQFKHCLFILSFSIPVPAAADDTESVLRQGLREFLPRTLLDEIRTLIPFRQLDYLDVRAVIAQFVARLNRALAPRQIALRLGDDACLWFYRAGRAQDEGLRNLAPLLERHITTPLRAMQNNRLLEAGNSVCVRVRDGAIALEVVAPAAV